MRVSARNTLTASMLALIALGLAPAALACRIILPPHPIPPPHRPMPPPLREMEVKSHRAEIEIDGRMAKVGVSAVFHNPNPRRIEGTYWFPIGKGAAVSSFSMTVNGKTLEAELLEADKAANIYRSIVSQMKDPALLEYMGGGMLRARVFPIEPNQDVKIELAYDVRVRRDGALSRVAYPLLSAKPGGSNTLQSLVVDVTVKTPGPLKTVFTPGFKSQITRPDPNRARVTFEANKYLPEKDFEVVFSDSREKVGLDFLAYKKGDDGYFMLFIAPDSELQAEEIAAKDIVFVIDTSGSMHGSKIKQAREALKFCVNSLSAKDAFNIVAFATDVNPFETSSVSADEANKTKALEFIDSLKARGGTAIDDALGFALKAKRREGLLQMVVFMTDGLPTIGETDVQRILARFKDGTSQRFFTFGVGTDVNTVLLDGVAELSRAYASYVRPGENLELALSSFYEKVASPVMTNLELDSGKTRLTGLNPPKLPDLFKGQQLALTGRYSGKGVASMTLSGEVGGRREKFPFKADLASDARNSFVPRMWAVSRVAFLEEQIRLHGKSGELIDEIKRLGRQFGILTAYTSFLVVEEGLKREDLGRAREAFRGFALEADAATGAGAVAQSMERRSKKAATPGLASPADGFWAGRAGNALGMSRRELRQLVVAAADKTFFLRQRDGFLYDSEIPRGEFPEADVEVKAWSDEFFALLVKHPALKKYLKAGLKLVVKLDGKVYRITD